MEDVGEFPLHDPDDGEALLAQLFVVEEDDEKLGLCPPKLVVLLVPQ